MSLKSVLTTRNRAVWPVAAAVLVVAAAGLYLLLQQKTVDAKALGLTAHFTCSTEPVTFHATEGSPERTVFRLDTTWHHVRPCLSQLLEIASKQPPTAPIHDFIYHQVLYVLSRKPVRFHQSGKDGTLHLKNVIDVQEQLDFSKFDSVAYTNEHGVPHNAMSQAEFGDILLKASEASRDSRKDRPDFAEIYRNLALASFAVDLHSLEAGGLRSRASCANKPEYNCSFFHAVTNPTRESPAAGGTLNKHLIAIRELFQASETLRAMAADEGRDDLAAHADAYEEAAVEGINQLSYAAGSRESGEPPNLIDYIPKTEDGRPVQESWLYYSFNPVKQNGYFLKPDPYRNCSYHMLVLNLLYSILKPFGHMIDLNGLTEPNSYLGKPILKFVVDSYRIKLDDGGLYVDSASEGQGQFNACVERHRAPLPPGRIKFLHDLGAGRGDSVAVENRRG